MKTKILIAAMLGLLSSSVMAQTKDHSLSLYGNYSKTSNVDGANGVIVGTYGYMPTEHLELSFMLGVSFNSGADNGTDTIAGADAKYYFGAVGHAGSLVPYVKAEVQSIASQTLYGAGAGIDYALSESASVFLEAVVQKHTNSDYSGTTKQLNLGLTYRF